MRIINFYLRLIAALQILFIVCGFAMNSLGSTQPTPSAFRGFVEGCEGIPQPCWYGILPGTTELNDALIMLQDRNFELHYSGSNYSEYIQPQSDDGCIVRLDFASGATSVTVYGVEL